MFLHYVLWMKPNKQKYIYSWHEIKKLFSKKETQSLEWQNVDGSVQDCSNSIANALELPQSCTKPSMWSCHYCDVIMGAISSQITSLTIVCSTLYSGVDQRKHQSSASLAFVRGIHRSPVKFPAQMASNAENLSIWWRHLVFPGSCGHWLVCGLHFGDVSYLWLLLLQPHPDTESSGGQRY